MSIYSGFATRRDESRYNDLLSRLINMLQLHLLQVIKVTNIEFLNKKVVGYAKIVSKMREFQEHKYLPPKFSQLLVPLCRQLGIGGCTPIPVAIDQIAIDDKRPVLERLKSGFSSTKHYKPKTKLPDESFDLGRMKKPSLYDELRSDHSQSRNMKKLLFESNNELREQLKQRKLNPNISREKVEVANTYEEEESLRISHGKEPILASQPTIMSNKVKNNLRYRALADAQQNLHKRPQVVRSDLRRKIKTNQDYSNDEL